jgi:SAM-dependent methyltransferase
LASRNDTPMLLRNKLNQELYLVSGVTRRRILHPDVASAVREQFPGIAMRDVTPEELATFEPGAHVPRAWTEDEWIEPPQVKQMMREIIVSRVKGTGVEFGAGSRPLPLPIGTTVHYAEPFQSAEQYARMGYTDNTVRARYKNPIEDQYEVEDGSLDFVVAAHVIEHTPNPIRAIVESYRKLRPGGQLVLVVPDKRRTFDKHRDLTTLEHLLLDFEKPDRQRDLENYLDFFRKAKRGPDVEKRAKEAHAAGIDIHYHVWEPGSFHRMMQHIVDHFAPFRSFELKPPVEDEHCLEFYMVARK